MYACMHICTYVCMYVRTCIQCIYIFFQLLGSNYACMHLFVFVSQTFICMAKRQYTKSNQCKHFLNPVVKLQIGEYCGCTCYDNSNN